LPSHFVWIILGLLGVAVAVYLVIAGLVYVGSGRRTKRYRPGRPFEFTSVWFLARPDNQPRADVMPGRELVAAPPPPPTRPGAKETGGASDVW
jgi:hypothetical protein